MGNNPTFAKIGTFGFAEEFGHGFSRKEKSAMFVRFT